MAFCLSLLRCVFFVSLVSNLTIACRNISDTDGLGESSSLNGLADGPLVIGSSDQNFSAMLMRAEAGDRSAEVKMVTLLDQWLGEDRTGRLRGGAPYTSAQHAHTYLGIAKDLNRSWQEAMPLITEWLIPESGVRRIERNPVRDNEAVVLTLSGSLYFCHGQACRVFSKLKNVQQVAYLNERSLVVATDRSLLKLSPDLSGAADQWEVVDESKDIVGVQTLDQGRMIATRHASGAFQVFDAEHSSPILSGTSPYALVDLQWDARYPDWILVVSKHNYSVVDMNTGQNLLTVQQVPLDMSFIEAFFHPDSEVEGIVSFSQNAKSSKLEIRDFSGERHALRLFDGSAKVESMTFNNQLIVSDLDSQAVFRLNSGNLSSVVSVQLEPTTSFLAVSGIKNSPLLVSGGLFQPIKVRDLSSGLIRSEIGSAIASIFRMPGARYYEVNPFDDNSVLVANHHVLNVWNRKQNTHAALSFDHKVDPKFKRHRINPHSLLFRSLPRNGARTSIYLVDFLATARHRYNVSATP